MTASDAAGVARLVGALAAALDAGTRGAFTAHLTDDVTWGGQNGGNVCSSRVEAGDFYEGLLAAGVGVRVDDISDVTDDGTGGGTLIVGLAITSPEPGDFPSHLTVRLTVRDGLVSDIRELDPPVGHDDEAAAVDAVRAGDVTALTHLLAGRPDLATARLARHGGRTLLHVATDWPGHLPNVAATITVLVRAGADPNAPGLGKHPETPLHWAASSDDVEAIDALLDAGADIEAPGAVIGGGTPMADATAFGQWAAAARLLERGARTTLFEAATLGLVARVERHLAERPTREDVTGSFWGACHGGRLDTASVLLDHGADLNWVGWDDLTPLDAARRSDAGPQLTAWLEQHGAKTAR